MKTVRLPLLAALIALLAGSAQAASIDGDWLTPKGGAKVRIAPCGPKLCGTITWLKNPDDKTTGQPQKDVKNADPALRTRPVVGLPILHGFKPISDGHWGGGSIYNPGDGKTYDSKITVNPDGTLKVEGCVAILCVAQTWTRAS